MIGRLLILVLLLAFWPVDRVHAHSTSNASLHIDLTAQQGRLELALRDLETAVGIDADGDGRITWTELLAAEPAIRARLATDLALAAADGPCTQAFRPIMVEAQVAEPAAVLSFDIDCGGAPITRLRYDLLFDLDPFHRVLAVVEGHDVAGSHVLSPERRVLDLEAPPGPLSSFRSYLRLGVWHILVGADHLLFLATLLLPAVLLFDGRDWRCQTSLRRSLVDLSRIVLAFTIAHSLTLAAAVSGLVALPSGPVEIVIAATIVLAALANLVPELARWRAQAAFVLGLVHGFGFAGALVEIGLPAGARLAALAGFNLGVELGQMLIVLAVAPLLFMAARQPFYPRFGMRAGSLAIAAIGLFWVVERL